MARTPVVSNWKRWIGFIEKKPVSVEISTHARLSHLSQETGMPMGYWNDIAVRFFLAHTKSAALVQNAKGITLEEFDQRRMRMDEMVERCLKHGLDDAEVVSQLDEPDKPLFPPRERPVRAKRAAPARRAQVNGRAPAAAETRNAP